MFRRWSSRRSVSGGRGGAAPRIYGPRNFADDFFWSDVDAERRSVLAKIERCYGLLDSGEEPLYAYGGLCFGLLDPASNLAVNAFLSPAAAAAEEAEAGGAAQAARAIERSLDGLVAFLTALFPHLPDEEAILHLDVLQVEQSWELAKSRCSRLLRAKPQALPQMHLARGARKRMVLRTITGFYLQAMARLPATELRGRFHRAMLHGGHCYGPLDPVSNIILNTIWYDQAFPMRTGRLNSISTKLLRRIAARSFYGLVSFHCTRYPGLTPDEAMRRLQLARADLRLADPNFDDVNNASRRSDSKLGCFGLLQQVLPVKALVFERRDAPATTVKEAYAAAATAAHHPNPIAQQELLGSSSGMAKLDIAYSDVLQDGCQLSSEDVIYISRLLLKCCPSLDESPRQQKLEPTKLSRQAYAMHLRRYKSYAIHHQRVFGKVEAVLAAFNVDRVNKYRLHIICGVNELVSGPKYSPSKEYNPFMPYKYYHCHINFLATCEDAQQKNAPTATLFFAECSNYGIADESWCRPVNLPRPDTEQPRCIYCEHRGFSIVHPPVKNFHGRDIEFEKTLHGERLFSELHKGAFSNYGLTNKTVDTVDFEDDDCIYANVCKEDDNERVIDKVQRYLEVCSLRTVNVV
ncbi:hypothetical protein ACP4OV_025239 [Aristida adscensionis]